MFGIQLEKGGGIQGDVTVDTLTLGKGSMEAITFCLQFHKKKYNYINIKYTDHLANTFF